jgi:hypothetical protein
MIRLGKTAALQVQTDFVNGIVLPHFYLFVPLVYALEVLTAVFLILGLFVRFWGGDRGAAGGQSSARPLQRLVQLAVDLFFSRDFDGDLRGTPVWPQPRRRRHHRRPGAGPRFDCADRARCGDLSVARDCQERAAGEGPANRGKT